MLKHFIAKLVIAVPFGEGEHSAYGCYCPKCAEWLGTNCMMDYRYCPECGQKLEWPEKVKKEA